MGWRGSRHTIVKFSDVAGLCAAVTDHYQNGFYQRTTHDYTWLTQSGATLATQQFATVDRGAAGAGARSGARFGPKPALADFIRAVATAWGLRRSEAARASLEKDGVAVFATRRGGFFSVRPGIVETNVSGTVTTLRAEDVVSTKLDGGRVVITTRSSTLRFATSDVADHAVAFGLAKRSAGLSLPTS